MATFTKKKLSGSTDGQGIVIAATATPGTLIHTAVAGTGAAFDEVWLWVQNTSASAVKVTIEYGGPTAPDKNIEYTVAAEDGPKLIIPGFILQNGLTIKAFAGTTNVLVAYGYVNAIA